MFAALYIECKSEITGGEAVMFSSEKPASSRNVLIEFNLSFKEELRPGKKLLCTAVSNETEKSFEVICRIDTPVELTYYRNGGILQYVCRQLTKE